MQMQGRLEEVCKKVTQLDVRLIRSLENLDIDIECYQVLVRCMKDDIMFLDEEKIRVKAMTCIGTEQW